MASADWKEPGATWLDWLYKCEQRGLDVVAITDHNTVAGVAQLRKEIERLQWLEAESRLRPNERRELDEYRRLGDKILVLPGFEFTATFGFHVLGIFPPETSVRQLEHILLDLNVPADRLDQGSTEVGATSDVLTAYKVIRQAGGIVIAAHANSTHGVAMRDFPFGGQTKIAYTQDANLHALEVTDLESRSTRATARFFDGSKPEYPRRMRSVQGSDAHRLNRDPSDKNRFGIGDRVTEIKLPSTPSFKAIKAVFESNDFALTRPYRRKDEPFDHIAAARAQGPNIVQAFHERMTRQGGRLFTILSDVVAFANTHGGTVYLGVGLNPGPPLGVDDVEQAIAELRREVESKVVPPLDVEIDALETQDRQIVRIQVPEGRDKPYCLDDSRIYLRLESDTVQAVRDEIVRLVRRSLVERGELVEPAKPASASQAESGKSRGRGRRGGNGKQPSVEAAPAPVEPAPDEPVVAEVFSAPPEPENGLRSPKVGVQIVDVQGAGRRALLHHPGPAQRQQRAKRDAEVGAPAVALCHQPTRAERRKPDAIQWVGDVGLVKAEKRAGKQRYDFAQRMPDGSVAVYYGVTEEGCDDPWRQFLVGQDQDDGAEMPENGNADAD
jgi:hypothetical protein